MEEDKYPDSLRSVLKNNNHENILDSNMFSAYIADELPVPKIDDPRKTQAYHGGVSRHPEYIRSNQINQIFTYIGFIKRTDNKGYREYLNMLFGELNRFLRVLEEIVFELDVTISQEIYEEQKAGLENFLQSYKAQTRNQIAWIEKIWKHQKIYLENIDMLMETLKLRGHVFDFRKDPLYEAVVGFCSNFFCDVTSGCPGITDYNFVANCCVKAARDKKSKTIWSGDLHIADILDALYSNKSWLQHKFPQIYLRASYAPRHYTQLFPRQ